VQKISRNDFTCPFTTLEFLPKMKRSVIGLFVMVMNNNELCSDWLFYSATHQQEENTGRKIYIFKYFLSQLLGNYTVYKKRASGSIINTRGIQTAFERSVDRVIVSLSRVTMHKLCLY